MKQILFTCLLNLLLVQSSTANDQLCCNQTLPIGSKLESPNRQYFLTFQADGNLVLYRKNGLDLWASNTSGKIATTCKMQADGNLVLYNGNTPIWSSNTNGHPNSKLILQDDGNLVIYDPASKPIWDTKTMQGRLVQQDEHFCCGQSLRLNARFYSDNKLYFIVMQDDGNLILYKNCSTKTTTLWTNIWASKTHGTGANRCVISSDGHISIMKNDSIVKKIPDNNEININSFLAVQGDGNLVLYNASAKPIWATYTLNAACPTPTVDIALQNNCGFRNSGQNAVLVNNSPNTKIVTVEYSAANEFGRLVPYSKQVFTIKSKQQIPLGCTLDAATLINPYGVSKGYRVIDIQ